MVIVASELIMLVRKLMAIALVFSLLSAVNAAAQNTGSVETVKQKVANSALAIIPNFIHQ
jgi:hypothetical protein